MASRKKKSTRPSQGLVWNPPIDLTDRLIQEIQGLQASVRTDYLKSQFLSKFVSKDTDPPELRRQRAIEKWLAVEMKNEETEDRLLFTPGASQILPRVSLDEFFSFCRHLVCEIIGETPPIEALIGSFSGGASTSRSRLSSHPAGKYVGEAHVTASALPWFDLLRDELPVWFDVADDLVIKEVPGNVLFTVPKKTDIDRCACKEPDLNMFIQKGIGNYFRNCLRRTGINLNDQSINRSLARVGSIDGRLVTLDLSSASDSVLTELVAQLLPVTWFNLLDAVRCHVTIIDGQEHRNFMFSSMGNGFTFELESLIFLVLARATARFTGTRGRISVYGDDIVCPAHLFRDLVTVLEFCGFSVNSEKSFASGPFRESCGGHYYDGVDITPFYIRKPIETLPELIDVANKLRKWASHGDSYHVILDPEVEGTWYWLKSLVPDVLWGGSDLSFRYQLVSDDVPSRRISEKMHRSDAGKGGYLQWLNATIGRTIVREPISTSEKTFTSGKYSLKKVRSTSKPHLSLFWYTECVQSTDSASPHR
jgi:hypothetical protein